MFEADCPYYISAGMTYEQYWLGDPWAIVAYRKADTMRRERKNQDLWLQGMYIYEAFCDVSPVLHAFAKSGTKPVPYVREPYPITARQAERSKEETAALERAKAIAYFDNLANDSRA